MNNVIFAGYARQTDDAADGDGWESGKHLKIFVPKQGGEGGRLERVGGERTFSWREIVVIPPAAAHRITAPDGGVTVLIEQPLLSRKSAEVIPDVENDGIRMAAEQAVCFFRGDSYGREGVLAALGNLLVSYLSAYDGEKKSPAVELLREDIEKNASDSAYSVEIAIRKLPLNYDYVRKLFKKETGLTPHEYLTGMRMERARSIILSGVSNLYSDYTVSQIAEACGFAEPLYFSRVFKKYFGVSPTNYAKRP